MNKNKIALYLLSLIASVVMGFFCAVFLQAALTNTRPMMRIAYLVSLVHDRRFLMLFVAVSAFIILCFAILSLDSKPYKSDLKEVAKGISIPVSAGQLQHGSARFLTDEEIDQAFASVVLPKPKLKQGSIPNERGDSLDEDEESYAEAALTEREDDQKQGEEEHADEDSEA